MPDAPTRRRYGRLAAEGEGVVSGDTVEFGATPYCGDAHFADWPKTLAGIKALGPDKLVPGPRA